MANEALRLEVAEFADPDRWRWVLKDGGCTFLADHAVSLERTDPYYAALVDLPGYLRLHATPDQHAADERRLIGEAGAWIGERVLGRSIGEKLLARVRPLADLGPMDGERVGGGVGKLFQSADGGI